MGTNAVTRNTHREANERNGCNAVSNETRKQTRMTVRDAVTVAEIHIGSGGLAVW